MSSQRFLMVAVILELLFFVMLDPFGLKGVSMDLIREILSVPHGEVLFSFMHEAGVRFR